MRMTFVHLLLVLGAIQNFTGSLWAQTDNPVYLDDSPQAWELFRQAKDQTRNNAGEAVRLYQELLDDFGLKLIPFSEATPDQFASVRQRVLETLADDQALLELYRLIQTPAAEQLLQAQDLQRLAMTRSLTEPGLEALLRLAQQDLEAARFYTALDWLEQAQRHPDLTGRRAAHCRFMTGLAWHYLNNPHEVEAAQEALAQLGAEGEAFRVQLERLAGNNDQPLTAPAQTPLITGVETDLHDLVPQSIWHVALDDSLTKRRTAAAEADQPAGGADPLQQRGHDTDLTTSVPTVVGDAVYVNEGHTILAINRLTGSQIWPPYSDVSRLSLLDTDRQDPYDLNVVAVGEGALVTVTGHALGSSRSEAGKIVCLNSENGTQRWSPVALTGLVEGAADEELFPHGAPVIADGAVIIAARKVSPQLLTSAYVVAFNLSDGKPRWVRYITSSGGLQARTRPFCSVLYANGAIYVASAVGATARLQPSTGEIRWLHRFAVPIQPGIADQSRRPWEIGGPVLTSRGLVAMEPDQRRVVLLDANTGEQLEDHSTAPSSDWNLPRYLLADDQNVYAIGQEIRAFHIDDLEHPVWRLPAAPTSGQDTKVSNPAAAAIDIKGRVQVVDSSLIVPSDQGVLVIDRDTGALRSTLSLQPIGNPMAVGSQLLMASADKLDSYMSFDKAQRMLREQFAQTQDPAPALILLSLGMGARDMPLALEAANMTMQAINRLNGADPADPRARTARAELFSQLLKLADTKIATSSQAGETLYATIGAVALEPEQRVEYLLSYGDWLTGTALDRAVETYQAILADRTLADSWRNDDGRMLPASTWATRRLSELIAKRGPSVYAPQADYAAMRLKQLNAAAPVNRDELMELARQFPFADASIDAAVQAAAIDLKRGDQRAALAALVSVHQAAPRLQTATRLMGRFISISEAAGWKSQARAMLRQIVVEFGDVPLATDAGERSAAAWLAAIAGSARDLPRLVKLGDVAGEAIPLSAGVVPPNPAAAPVLPIDRVLMRDGSKYELIGANMQPIWTSTIEGEMPQILRFDERGILLWFGADPQDPKAAMLNPADGTLRWTTPRLSELLGDPVRDLGRARGIRDQMPDGEPFNPGETLPIVSDESIIFLRRSGGAVAFDLADGRTVRWTRKQTLEQVHVVTIRDGALVLAGMAREIAAAASRSVANGAARAAGELSPRILILDPHSGQPLFDPENVIRPAGRTGVKWLKISPTGLLVSCTVDGLEAFDLCTGDKRWSNSSYAVVNLQHGWMDERLIVEDQRSRLRTVNPREGTVSEPFEAPLHGEWDPLDLRDVMTVNGMVVAHYPQRVVVFDPDTGAVAGADVVTDERDYHWLVPAADRLVAISTRSQQIPMGAQPGMRSQYVYRLYSMSHNGKVLGEPDGPVTFGDHVQQVLGLDGWLLLSTQSDTLAIPMPVTPKDAN